MALTSIQLRSNRTHGLFGRIFFVGLGVALCLAAGARAADRVSIPVDPKARKTQALPAGESIRLSIQEADALALQNTLDLSVSAYTFQKAAFGIGSAGGVFDPYLEIDPTVSRTQTPTTSLGQSGDTKILKVNTLFGGLLPWGTTYTASWFNQRYDSVSAFTQINPTFTSNLSLTAAQPLLRNFGRTVNTRFVVQARYSRDQSAWDFVRSVQNTIQSVENAYWDLSYAQQNLVAKREALDRARDLNRITKIKIDVGALAPIDIVQTEVTIAQREQDIILAEGLIGDAQDRLKRLLNVTQLADWNRPVVATDLPLEQEHVQALDVDDGIKNAFELRSEVRQVLLDIESKKLTLAYSRNQLLPRLDLTASYGYAGVGAQKNNYQTCAISGTPVDQCPPDQILTQRLNYSDAFYQIRRLDFPSWSVGLVFNVPIGNHTARANAASAGADLELSRTNLALLKLNLQVEVRAAARAVDTALRSVAAAKKARELAERNLDAEKKKYENGMTTSFNVSQIQNDLTNAQSNELQAIAGYVKSVVAWHKATGDILQAKNIEVTGLPIAMERTPAEEGAVR